MKLIPESSDVNEYVQESDIVDYSHPLIQEHVQKLFRKERSELEQVKAAFEFVRDEVSHSWDIQSRRVTCKASEVLLYREGICYAKSNLLAALLRAAGIPAGFCYQRLLLFDTPEEGYCIHTLNGVFLRSLHRWIRLDARGNKPGVQAAFSIEQEMLAFPVRKAFGEQDDPVIYTKPNEKTMAALEANTDLLEMYIHHLPDSL